MGSKIQKSGCDSEHMHCCCIQAEIEVDRSESVVTRKDSRTREVNENVDVRLNADSILSFVFIRT